MNIYNMKQFSDVPQRGRIDSTARNAALVQLSWRVVAGASEDKPARQAMSSRVVPCPFGHGCLIKFGTVGVLLGLVWLNMDGTGLDWF